MRHRWKPSLSSRRTDSSSGMNGVLVIDDTALPKKGGHSVGVAAQYTKRFWARRPIAETLVSATLAGGEVPVVVGLRMSFMPRGLNECTLVTHCLPGGCTDRQTFRSKPKHAIKQVDRL